MSKGVAPGGAAGALVGARAEPHLFGHLGPARSDDTWRVRVTDRRATFPCCPPEV
jgi:hypothetical protein